MMDLIQDFADSISEPPTATDPGNHPLPTVINGIKELHTKAGTNVLWIVFAIMFLSTVAFAFMALRVPIEKRLFHVLTTFITLFAAISYFSMAVGSGTNFAHSVIYQYNKVVGDTPIDVYREIYWARYVDWALTTPLLLLDLSFLAGLPGADIVGAVIADEVMILTGLFAVYGKSEGEKWGYYAMACAAYIAIVGLVAVSGRRTALSKDAKTAKFFSAIGGFTFILWTLYPIVWGLGDGARVLSVDAEISAYAILDVLAKPVFGFWLLIVHDRNSSASVGGFWTHGLENHGAVRLDDDEGA